MSTRRLRDDVSLSAVTAGVVAVLVGFTSSVAIVFQAATALGATPAQIASWMWALGVGMAIGSVLPSLHLRMPVMLAWSTPGAVVLATAAAGGGYTLAQATGAFLVCGALIALSGVTGAFERLMDRIPMPLANALLAGVLARFALDAVGAARTDLALLLAMLLAYLVGRRFWPRYAVPGVLAVGVAIVAGRGQLSGLSALSGGSLWTVPVFVMPEFTVAAAVGLALPLFVVTMASQNLPGVAAIRAAGYPMPISKLITLSGVLTLLLAPFGAFALNLSALTAALCMDRESHPDPARRYVATVTTGVIYLLIGLSGAAVAGVMAAFPRELVVGIAGVALLGTIGGALNASLQDERWREGALLTFLVTLSGVVVAGVGSAFWGVLVGGLALFVQQWRRPAPRA